MKKYQIILLAFIIVIASCSQKPAPTTSNSNPPSTPPSLRNEMSDIRKNVTELMTYIWTKNNFYQKENDVRISSILHNLKDNFHTVEKVESNRKLEPGFKIALNIQQDLLSDAAKRFDQGKKDYVKWRLQNLTTNCIACHSRYQIAVDVMGLIPAKVVDGDFKDDLSYAQYLFAVRQFDESSKELEELIKLAISNKRSEHDILEVTKMWLVLAVRMNKNIEKGDELLDLIITSADLSRDNLKLLQQWKNDLHKITTDTLKYKTESMIERAKRYVELIENEESIDIITQNLVLTLKATQLLHLILESASTNEDRKEAAYFLAVAYLRLPISFFYSYREYYLESVIREFPHTVEARKSYKLLQQLYLDDNTGISGAALDIEAKEKLKELKKLSL